MFFSPVQVYLSTYGSPGGPHRFEVRTCEGLLKRGSGVAPPRPGRFGTPPHLCRPLPLVPVRPAGDPTVPPRLRPLTALTRPPSPTVPSRAPWALSSATVPVVLFLLVHSARGPFFCWVHSTRGSCWGQASCRLACRMVQLSESNRVSPGDKSSDIPVALKLHNLTPYLPISRTSRASMPTSRGRQ